MLNGEINMSVSSMTRKDGEKAVYVLFADKSRSAEFTLPELKLLNSNGFSAEEITGWCPASLRSLHSA